VEEKCVCPPSEYKSYLLRLWTATQDGKPVWRASLQSTITSQRQGFPDLESLFAYLVVPADDEKVTPDRKTEPTTDN
jgi:hypothetical protein